MSPIALVNSANNITKRYYYYTNNSNSARYAGFAAIGVVALIIIFCVCWGNVRRVRRGNKPFQYTTWMMPPSYGRSQQEHQQQQQELPVYSENTNPNQDYGYFNDQGVFIPSKQQGNDDPYLQNPPAAYVNQSQNPQMGNSSYGNTENGNSQTYYTQSDPQNHYQANATYYRPPAPPPTQ